MFTFRINLFTLMRHSRKTSLGFKIPRLVLSYKRNKIIYIASWLALHYISVYFFRSQKLDA